MSSLNPDSIRKFAELIAWQRTHNPPATVEYAGSTYQVESRALDLDLDLEPTFHYPALTDRDLFTERTADALAKVRDVIMERGWIQGEMRTPDGVCLLGGIDAAAFGDRQHRAVQAVLERYLGSLIGLPHGINIPKWNDSDGRTFNEVITVLDGCIAWVKEKING